VMVYLLEVDKVSGNWLEKDQRRREWVSTKEAAKRVAEDGLTEISARRSELNMFSVNEVCIARHPSHQNAVDLFSSWSSAFPPNFDVTTNGIPLFADSRVSWAIEQLGGVSGKNILELGPLEGGHTYMLENAGAASILAIEGNKNCFVKCLIAKEITRLERSRFMLGDFVEFLKTNTQRYDIAWVAGVLYHMTDPVELLTLLGRTTDAIYIWTHYIDAEALTKTWSNPVVAVLETEKYGRTYTYYHRSYEGAQGTSAYSGGVYSGAVWLTQLDLMAALDQAGFKRLMIQSVDPHHPNGPAISLVAQK
ncbi:MAG: DUF1698 domain-containing protein, partial [Beijerinckiaceae bacterium]|nr:DUF1698 domain-containing protein [Beijerinckiaceae bacterium]